MEEKTLSSKIVYDGRIMTVRCDEIETADGHHSFREVVEHSGGVTIVAVKNDSILFVKQFRYPIKEVVLELPAGKLEKGEDPDVACERELEEETGYRAKHWTSLGFIYTSIGFCNEKLYLYLAQDLEFVGEHPDEGEILENYEYKITEVEKMIADGRISDAKTICAIYRALGEIKND
ncbi:MAG: NUDIX hydrolase [Fusobacterium sp.]|nr:NUDIX hydrolase [Fusobacterium sp.]